MPGFKLIPYGELEGRVAVTVDVGTLDLEDPTCIVRAVVQSRMPGARAVILEGPVPWGAVELDRALMTLAADARTEGADVWAHRAIDADRWCATPVWWAMDATGLFQQPHVAQLIADIEALAFLPPPTEIIVRTPNPAAVSTAALDELGTRLDIGAGWVYVDPSTTSTEELDAMVAAVAKAVTPWGIRTL